MTLLVETRKYARQNPDHYEEILNRYEKLLPLAKSHAPQWATEMQNQIQAMELAIAAPLDDAEHSIRLKARQFEELGQHQAGIDWLNKYSGPFVGRTKRLRETLAASLQSAKK